MRDSFFYKFTAIALSVFAVLVLCQQPASAQRPKLVTVKFETGIYRDWDRQWMTTAPSDVIATISTSKGTFTKSPNNRDTVIFTSVPCGETVKINIRFVGTGGYKSRSRNYTKKVSCSGSTVNLGRLEFGTW